jgi:hypothetical protein
MKANPASYLFLSKLMLYYNMCNNLKYKQLGKYINNLKKTMALINPYINFNGNAEMHFIL